VAPSPDRPPRRRWRRWLGLAFLGGLGVAATLGCAGASFGVWLTTDSGDQWLEAKVQELASSALTEGTFAAADVDVDLDGTVAAEGIRLVASDGTEVLHLPRVDAKLDLAAAAAGRVRIRSLDAQGAYVDLVADEQGVMLLSRMFGGSAEVDPDAEPWQGLPVPVKLDDIDVRGLEMRMGGPDGTSTRLVGVDIHGRMEGRGTTLQLHDLQLGAMVDVPGPLPVSATAAHLVYRDGDIEVDALEIAAPGTQVTAHGVLGEELDLEVLVPQLHLDPLDPVAGGAGITGQLEGSARVLGSWDDARCIVTVDGTKDTEGTLRLRLGANLTAATPTWSVDGEIQRLHVHQLMTSLAEGEPIVVDGDLDLTGQGFSWPVGLSASGRFRGGEQALAGLSLSSLDVGVVVEEGAVHLQDDSVIDGVVGEIRPTGWYDVVSGLVDLRVEGVARPAELSTLGATGFGRPGTFDVRVLGDVTSDDPLDIEGEARFAPFVYQGDMVVSQLRLGVDLLVQGSSVGGGVSVAGTGVDAYGVTAGGLASEDLRLAVTPEGEVALDGRLELSSVDMPSVFRTDWLRTDLDVAVAGGGTKVDAELAMGPYALLEQPGSDGVGRVKMSGDLLDFEVKLRDGRRETAYTIGRFRMDDQTVDLPQLHLAPTFRIDWRNERPVHFRLTEDGGITDADVVLDSALGHVELEGQVGTAGPLDAKLTLEDVQADMLAELYPDDLGGLSGSASAVVRFAGTGEVPDVKATIDLRDLYYPEQVRYLDILGVLHWTGGRLEPDLKLSVADEPFAVIEGAAPLPGSLAAPELDLDRDASLVLGLRPSRFARVAQLSPAVDPDSLPVGSYSASLHLDGPLRQPALHLAGVAEFDIEGWGAPGRVEFDAVRDGPSLSFWADLREGFKQRANLGGGGATRFGEVWTWAVEGGDEPDFEDYTLFLDDMFVSGVLLGVPLDSLLALAETELDVEGELVGGVSVSGSPVQPVVEGGVHLLDPAFAGEQAEGAYLSLSPAEQGYDLDAELTFADGGMAVRGPVPVQIDLDEEVGEWTVADLGLEISGDGVPLSLLALIDPGFKKAEGMVVLSGSVGGRADDPDPVIEVVLEDGTLQYAPLDLSVTDLDLRATATRRRVQLERLVAELEPRRRFKRSGINIDGESPRISATGTANLEDWQPGAMSAQVALRNGAWLTASDDLTLRLDGDLQASGRWPELRVVGDTELVYGKVVLDAASFIDTAPKQLDDRMVVTRASHEGGDTDDDAPEEPPIYADFDIDVGVALKRNLEVDVAMPFIDDLGSLGAAVTRLDASARLGGDLDATITEGALDLVGEVDVLEGSVRVLRSAFDLNEGSVVFSGGDPFNPQLDLNAVMNVTGATVEMSIGGTPEDPAIDFTSEEYPDQTQIMTILLTGQAPDSLDSDQGQGTAQALAGLLLNSLFSGQSLGSFSIEPDGSVKLGVPISQSVYANSQLAPSANPTENRLTVGLEWSVLPRVVASGAVGDRTQSADVFWEIRF